MVFETKLQENIVKFTSHINITSFNRKPLRLNDSVEKKLRSVLPKIKNVDAVFAA